MSSDGIATLERYVVPSKHAAVGHIIVALEPEFSAASPATPPTPPTRCTRHAQSADSEEENWCRIAAARAASCSDQRRC